jgi:hypothetical protein
MSRVAAGMAQQTAHAVRDFLATGGHGTAGEIAKTLRRRLGAVVEGYWQNVTPGYPPLACPGCTPARPSSDTRGTWPPQACCCIVEAIKEAFGDIAATENDGTQHGA